MAGAVVLTIGLIGEWPESEVWHKKLPYKLAKAAVVIGVIAELLGDGGIFETSARLKALEDTAIQGAITESANANLRAGNLEVQAAELRKQNLKLEATIQPRDLTPIKREEIADAIRKYAGHKVVIQSAPIDLEGTRLATEIMEAVTKGALVPDDMRGRVIPTGTGLSGVQVSGPITEDGLATELAEQLGKSGIATSLVTTPLPPGSSVTVQIGAKPTAE